MMSKICSAIFPCWHQDPDTRPPIIKEPGEDAVDDDDQSDEDTEESKSNITKGG